MNCQIIPAIDLMEGRCVRLRQGCFEARTDYEPTPLEMARLFERLGYEWLHLIDLDGARDGATKNLGSIQTILSNTSLKVQVGGGLRLFSSMADLLNRGVSRVMVGSVAISDPEVIRDVMDRYGPDSVVAAMDLK